MVAAATTLLLLFIFMNNCAVVEAGTLFSLKFTFYLVTKQGEQKLDHEKEFQLPVEIQDPVELADAVKQLKHEKESQLPVEIQDPVELADEVEQLEHEKKFQLPIEIQNLVKLADAVEQLAEEELEAHIRKPNSFTQITEIVSAENATDYSVHLVEGEAAIGMFSASFSPKSHVKIQVVDSAKHRYYGTLIFGIDKLDKDKVPQGRKELAQIVEEEKLKQLVEKFIKKHFEHCEKTPVLHERSKEEIARNTWEFKIIAQMQC